MNKRIILDKEDNYGNFHLEEYYPYRDEKYGGFDQDSDLVNAKSIKIEIKCPDIDKAIDFLQECKKEIKKEEN